MLMKSLKRVVFYVMAFFFSVILIVLISINILSKYDCNIHGKKIFVSPDGNWQVVQSTTGCPTFSIIEDGARWNTKVYLEKNVKYTKTRYLIFENNSAYSISIKWINNSNIDIILNTIFIVEKSRRSVLGVDISYSLSKSVLNYIDNSIKSANETGQRVISPAINGLDK